MTKEDKQIIERAIKENWRIGDRTRLKRLLKKNLELYRENAKLESVFRICEKKADTYYVQLIKAKGLLNEMRIALRQTKDGAKYNVSLLEDVDKLLKEIEK